MCIGIRQIAWLKHLPHFLLFFPAYLLPIRKQNGCPPAVFSPHLTVKSFRAWLNADADVQLYPLQKNLDFHLHSYWEKNKMIKRKEVSRNSLGKGHFCWVWVDVCVGLFFFFSVPLPRGYIPHPPAPVINSLFVHPLSALNNFLPDPTVPAKFRSRFQNLTFKFHFCY